MTRERVLWIVAFGVGALALAGGIVGILGASRGSSIAPDVPRWKRRGGAARAARAEGSRTGAHRPLPCEGAACEARCEQGDRFACHRLGQTAIMTGDVGPPPSTIERLEKNCTADFAASCYTLGDLVSRGLGVTKDEPRAEALYVKGLALATAGCDGGDPFECTIAALMQQNGRGVARSEERAKELFDRAGNLDRELCDSGRADACILAVKGYGYPRRPPPLAEAVRLVARACELGEAEACAQLKKLQLELDAKARADGTPRLADPSPR